MTACPCKVDFPEPFSPTIYVTLLLNSNEVRFLTTGSVKG